MRNAVRQMSDGICWLQQWKLPPPDNMASLRNPTISRPGKKGRKASSAA
jgi:hypothetical protein